jgi:hypothetical protein
MRRARVKPQHMMRCSLYSFDLLAWSAMTVVLAVGLPWLNSVWTFPRLLNLGVQQMRLLLLMLLIFFTIGVCAAISARRLWLALRLYLRFDHAFATMVASQTIVALTELTLLAVLFPEVFREVWRLLWW